MSEPLQVIGSYLSPYVRKVLAVLELKGLTYQVDSIVPFYGDDRFSALSPLRQVPVLIDGDLVVNDSTVICQYLEERYPQCPLYPADIVQRTRARWLEEFADSRMGQVVIWQLFNQLVIRRNVWGEAPDEALLKQTYEVDLPELFDYLESQVPASGFCCGELSIADISLASFMRNAQFSRYAPDAQRWPKWVALVERVLGLPAFVRLATFEQVCARTPIAEQRQALQAAGAPLTAVSCFRAQPQAGPVGRR